jgi:hypothetical protein
MTYSSPFSANGRHFPTWNPLYFSSSFLLSIRISSFCSYMYLNPFHKSPYGSLHEPRCPRLLVSTSEASTTVTPPLTAVDANLRSLPPPPTQARFVVGNWHQ